MIKISIVIPIFNSKHTLSTCIDSVLSQTYTDFEILLIDDGSTDETGFYCDKYAEKDSRIHVVHQENGGPSKARNAGLETATGQYACFMDSDDFLENEALETIVSYIKKYNPSIIKYGYKKKQPSEEIVVSCGKPEFITEKWEMLDRTEGTQYCGFVWNSAFRKDCISDIRFREDFKWCEDHLFSYECFRKAKSMLLIPDVLYVYNIHDNGLSDIRNPYVVYYMAQAEFPIKMSLVDKTHFETWKGVWAEYYGKLNYAVKVLFDGKPSYKKAAEYKKSTISDLCGFSFPATCKYGRVFYKWPFAIAYAILRFKCNR